MLTWKVLQQKYYCIVYSKTTLRLNTQAIFHFSKMKITSRYVRIFGSDAVQKALNCFRKFKVLSCVTFDGLQYGNIVRSSYPYCVYTGIPAATERLKLEMTVSYNTFLFSLGFSNPSEIEESLSHTLLRGKQSIVLFYYYGFICSMFYVPSTCLFSCSFRGCRV